MCEFKVFLDDEKVFDDAIYLAWKDGNVVLRAVLGETKIVEHCRIVEVNVASQKVVLTSRK